MNSETPITTRSNERRSWFAVWTWRPWVRWTICVLMLLSPVAYLLSLPPAFHYLRLCGIDPYDDPYWHYFEPAEWMNNNVPGIDELITWEFELWDSNFPMPQLPAD